MTSVSVCVSVCVSMAAPFASAGPVLAGAPAAADQATG